MTKADALREVIDALGGTPTGNTTSELIYEIATLVGESEPEPEPEPTNEGSGSGSGK